MSEDLNKAEMTAPAAMPATLSLKPCARIRRRTLRPVAPMAIRMPISCVRRLTEYAITPYRPSTLINKTTAETAVMKNVLENEFRRAGYNGGQPFITGQTLG